METPWPLFRYQGYSNFLLADICKVVIVGYFEYKSHIAPACIEFVENASEKYPKHDIVALVAGWGLTKVQGHWAPSDILQSFEIPVVNLIECKEKAPRDFKNNVINDKVCSWFLCDYFYWILSHCRSALGMRTVN